MKRFIAVFLALIPACLPGAEIARLSPGSWDKYVPSGKEVDCIYGDYVLRNEHLVAVIADPLATRHANMTVKSVGGMIIDLTVRGQTNDQLSCYYANAMPLIFANADSVKIQVGGQVLPVGTEPIGRGDSVRWEASTTSGSGLQVTVQYELTNGNRWLAADTLIRNSTDRSISQELSDMIRADRTFEFGGDEKTGLFWASDDFFRQAYGVIIEGRQLKRGGNRNSVLQMLDSAGSDKVELKAGESLTIRRKIFPGSNLLDVKQIASQLSGDSLLPCTISVEDGSGPVSGVKVSFFSNGQPYGAGYTNKAGRLETELREGKFTVEATAPAREPIRQEFAFGKDSPSLALRIKPCGVVVGNVTDTKGKPIPCKIAFHGQDGTPTPDYGPDSTDTAVKNLFYSHQGKFRHELLPGKYEVIISFGPEYDAVFQQITVTPGEETPLEARLERVVDTTGWVSADFHSHSSPSGDNTSSQLGRVQNLLCENVEFCPCTEHNRIDSYEPWLKTLGVEHLMATCSGMELTGQLLPVNHQNAFPLVQKPRTQDGGGPVIDMNPVIQIERLALWDGNSDKLVQENHPNLVQLFADKDEDGKFDGGFAKMLDYMDVMEVHPLENIFSPPTKNPDGKLTRNPAFHWMQLLNLGYRIPAVANTDAHYNWHGSGWLRNYLKSSTDDPANIDTLDMVHTAEQGHLTMATGPFLDVSLQAKNDSSQGRGIPGDDVIAPGGLADLHVRVQCSNWLDINRVQVFINGRASKGLNFTRRETPERFQDGVTKFEATIPIELKQDSHLIVATIGEGLQLGRVMGDSYGKLVPVALANPIFVDLEGNGFQANGDLLDLPFPK